VSIVDDDESVRDALKGFMQSVGFAAAIFSSADDFLGSDILEDELLDRRCSDARHDWFRDSAPLE
jgi:FixJ family two-component response regulator